MRKYSGLVALFLLFAAACGPAETNIQSPVPASPTVLSSETPTSTSTSTLRPPTPTSTPVLVEGTLTIKVNVRSGPGTEFDFLGQLQAGDKVQIASKNKTGTWYQILYDPASQGRGWVAAQYVQVKAGVEIPLDATATPTGPTGVVLQRLNVRSGPATTFDTLGMIQAKAVVLLTGKNAIASWFQIDYASGPGGHGWVTAQYVQTEAAASLPVLDDYGTPVASAVASTPSGPAATLTPTIGIAFPDRDSREAPAIKIVLSATGTDQFTYSSQVSTPEGDAEDWVEFTPYSAGGAQARFLSQRWLQRQRQPAHRVVAGGIRSVQLGKPRLRWHAEKAVALTAGLAYEMRLAPTAGEGLRLVDCVLKVQNR